MFARSTGALSMARNRKLLTENVHAPLPPSHSLTRMSLDMRVHRQSNNEVINYKLVNI